MNELLNQVNLPYTVNEVLEVYFYELDSKLPGMLSSFYVFGSLSLGAFIEGRSDIDFYAVMKRPLTVQNLKTLKSIHRQLKKQFKNTSLDGKYTTQEQMFDCGKTATLSPYFNDGVLIGFQPFDRESIDVFQLKKYGIVIQGKPIERYQFPENWTHLKKTTLENVNTYWSGWIARCERKTTIEFLASLFSTNFIEWGVLGVSRLYFTLKEADIISKTGAGEYALQHVPAIYHLILTEALRIRSGLQVSCYSSIITRRRDMLHYMNYVIEECNKLGNEKEMTG